MNKYFIVAVHYVNSNNSRFISEVKTLEPTTKKLRAQVISDINSGWSVMTAIKGSDGRYYEGADVHIITIDGIDYLRSDGNDRAYDNLENLEEY